MKAKINYRERYSSPYKCHFSKDNFYQVERFKQITPTQAYDYMQFCLVPCSSKEELDMLNQQETFITKDEKFPQRDVLPFGRTGGIILCHSEDKFWADSKGLQEIVGKKSHRRSIPVICLKRSPHSINFV